MLYTIRTGILQVADIMYAMAHKHVGKRNILYRIFYYDCMPLGKKAHNPISKKAVDFSKTSEYKSPFAVHIAMAQAR